MDGQSDSCKQKERYEAEINLVEYYRVLKKYYKMIVAIVFMASVMAVIVSLCLPKMYRAEALIVPISGKSGAGLGGLSSQLGSLASIAGVNLSGGQSDGVALGIILNCRTFTENVITKGNFIPVLFDDSSKSKSDAGKNGDQKESISMERAVRVMKGVVSVMEDHKTGTIKIGVEFQDPEMAAKIANAYLGELQNFIDENALTNAKKHRIFIGKLVSQRNAELLEIEKKINNFYAGRSTSSTNVDINVKVGGQGSKTLDTRNTDSLMSEKTENDKKINEFEIIKNVPQNVYLGYLLRQKDLLQQIQLSLSGQYESAKIQESKEEIKFTIIDSAVPPERKISPRRAQICIMSFFTALIGAISIAFLRDYVERMRARV